MKIEYIDHRLQTERYLLIEEWYLLNNDTLWVKIPGSTPDAVGELWVRLQEDGGLRARYFRRAADGMAVWVCGAEFEADRPDLAAMWQARDNAPRATLNCAEGRGYSGGHNTAEREGWPVSSPAPAKQAVIWWENMNYGRFTGCHPVTYSIVA